MSQTNVMGGLSGKNDMEKTVFLIIFRVPYHITQYLQWYNISFVEPC